MQNTQDGKYDHGMENVQDITDEFGGSTQNPELYKRLSQPYATEELAKTALNKFLQGVRKLREECGVPEIMVLASAYINPEKEGDRLLSNVNALVMGSSEVWPELAAMAFSMYTAPILKAAEEVNEMADRLRTTAMTVTERVKP